MEDSKIMISCHGIEKKYALYKRRIDRLFETLNPVNKSYHTEFYALNGIDFDVRAGECVGIVGRNGSGKSTLLKILTGVLSPTRGTVKVNGRVSALLELGAGFNPEYTGIENIYLNGTIMGFSREEMEQKLPEIVAFADIGECINQPVKIYSSGMFVRLAFATAISVEPEILIIDEALAVGDVYFQLKCYKKIEEFKKSGKTILFVSHDQSSIIKYCDRAILLDKGIMISDEPPRDAIDRYKKILAESNSDSDSPLQDAATQVTPSNPDVCWKSAYQLNEKDLTYGDHRAEILDFGIFDQNNSLATTFERNAFYTIKMRIHFNQKVTNPIFAITFKDFAGLEIAGTNTIQENIETGTFEKGATTVVHFYTKFPFQNHPLFLSLGCTCFDAHGELQVLHRLYDILCIQTYGAKITNGFFDMDAKVSIER